MTKMEKAKKFVSEHKKEILLVTVSAVGGAVTHKVVRSSIMAAKFKIDPLYDVMVMFCDVAKVSDFVTATDDSYTISQLGKLGEDAIKHCTDGKLTPETLVTGATIFAKREI